MDAAKRAECTEKISLIRELNRQASPAPWIIEQTYPDIRTAAIVRYGSGPTEFFQPGVHNDELIVYLRNNALDIIEDQKREIVLLKNLIRSIHEE